jgi:N-acetyl sugar amidotransferase
MKICKRCIQPDSRPSLYFNKDGICGACIWEDEKELIDWVKREKELIEIASWAKNNSKSNYDCVIGVSGGKDSTKQAITARDRLGLRCLLVNGEPDNITDVGKDNIENLKNVGFDVLSIRPNPKLMKKLVKRDFYKYLNPVKITEYSLYASSYIVAEQFNIPLIIQGENAGLTLGISSSGLGKGYDALKANQGPTLGSGWMEYLEVEGVLEKDLFLFHYDQNRLRKKNIQAIYIQYFLKEWGYRGNAEFAQKHGLKFRENFNPENIGTYMPFAQLDTTLHVVNQMLKSIKLGFGECVDHACYDFRDGRISRSEAIDLVKKYDGKCDPKYIDEFCQSIDITIDEFWKVVNKFRGPMWKLDSQNNWKNTYIEMLDAL